MSWFQRFVIASVVIGIATLAFVAGYWARGSYVGIGGEAVEYVGEWDLPLNRPLYRAFSVYLARRG